MNSLTLLLVALLGLAETFVIDSDAYPWKSDSKCSQCLLGGNIFCIKKFDNFTVPQGQVIPETKCCIFNGTECTDNVFADPEWFCSNSYDSNAYAMTALCPKLPDKCGNHQIFMLNRMN
jgi:hypothetical protein